MKWTHFILVAVIGIVAYALGCNGKKQSDQFSEKDLHYVGIEIERSESGRILKVNGEPVIPDTVWKTKTVFVEKPVRRKYKSSPMRLDFKEVVPDTVIKIVEVEKEKPVYLSNNDDELVVQRLLDSLDVMRSRIESDTGEVQIYAGIQQDGDYGIVYTHHVRGELLRSGYSIKFPDRQIIQATITPSKAKKRRFDNRKLNLYPGMVYLPSNVRSDGIGFGMTATANRLLVGYDYDLTNKEHVARVGYRIY